MPASPASPSSIRGQREDSPIWRRLAVAAFLVSTFVVFIGTVDFGFVYDDWNQIVLNPFLRSWRFFWRYFQRDVWSQGGRGQTSNYYRPIFLAWLRLNYLVFHLKPAGWHLAVVLLHLIVTWLVYRLALHLFPDWRRAALAAALFGLDPIHLETVAWISGVTDPLLTVFVLASFLSYLRFRSKQNHPWFWAVASWAMYFMATLTKETAVAFPVVILSYELFLGPSPANEPTGQPDSLVAAQKKAIKNWGARLRQALACAAPFVFLTLAYLYIRFLVLGGLIAWARTTPWQYALFTLPWAIWFYLRLLVWPGPLSVYYNLHWVRNPGFADFWLPLLALSVVVIALLFWSRGRPRVGFAALWLVLFLGPVLDLALLPSADFIQDRYLYLPSIGFSILLAEFLTGLFSRLRRSQRHSLVAAVPMLAVLMAYAGSTLSQETYWANDLLLYDHAIKVSPGNPYASNALGAALMKHHHYRQAIKLFRSAIAAMPKVGYPWENLAYLYYQTGHYAHAARCARQYLQIYPNAPNGLYLLGISEYQLGHYRLAADSLAFAVALKPHAYGFHYALGLALLKQGHPKRALIEFEAEPRHSTQRGAAQRQIALLEKTFSRTSATSSAGP